MTLIKFEPFREVESFHNKIQKYFDNFSTLGFNFQDNFSPRIDITEDENHLYVTAEIPGVTKKEIKITLQDNILTIEGEKKKEVEKQEKNFFRSERVYGSFKRSFTLHKEIDPDKVDARFEKGILKIEFKKLDQKPVNDKEIKLN
jgi:HSP20 family protein